jgi:hypothetical protein
MTILFLVRHDDIYAVGSFGDCGSSHYETIGIFQTEALAKACIEEFKKERGEHSNIGIQEIELDKMHLHGVC